jgi:zinc protease
MVVAGEVDGIPVFWTQGTGTDGTYTAGLVFRVGRVDETLAGSGITHLLEHLVLHELGADPSTHVNGQTAPLTTTFLTKGSAEDVTGFLDKVCAGLRQPPTERMPKEKQVLRVEGAQHTTTAVELAYRHRYGARGYGLLSFPEMGLDSVSETGLADWSARGFTRGNAALWLIGGPPPADLRLDLPAGERIGVPELPVTIRSCPSYFTTNVVGPTFCGLVTRSTAGHLYRLVLDERLKAELRWKQALSYSPNATSKVRDGRHLHVLAGAEGLSESMSVLVGEFVRVVARLADKPVTEQEFDAAAKRLVTAWAAPSAAAAQTRSAAENTLLGKKTGTVEAWKSRLAGLSPDDLRPVAEEAFGTGVFVLPGGHNPFRADITHVPWFSPRAISGREARPVDAPFAIARLIIGPDGVSLVQAGAASTVRFAECAALEVWPDGARRLIGDDGISVAIEPTMWRLPSDAIARIDGSVPGDRHVPMPYRPPDGIPRPVTSAGMRLAGRVLAAPVTALALTAVFTVVIAVLVGLSSSMAGAIAGGVLLAVALTSASLMREARRRLWAAAARRA